MGLREKCQTLIFASKTRSDDALIMAAFGLNFQVQQR